MTDPPASRTHIPAVCLAPAGAARPAGPTARTVERASTPGAPTDGRGARGPPRPDKRPAPTGARRRRPDPYPSRDERR